MTMESAQQTIAANGLTKAQKVWNVVPSEFSHRCSNPIRKIVDNIKKPESLDKPLIPLSLGAFVNSVPLCRQRSANRGLCGLLIMQATRLSLATSNALTF